MPSPASVKASMAPWEIVAMNARPATIHQGRRKESSLGNTRSGVRIEECPPNHFVDIFHYLKKIGAINTYESEMRPYPLTCSLPVVESLSRLRGGSVGLKAAEAFPVVRQLI